MQSWTDVTEQPHLVVDARMMHHAGIGVYIRQVVPRVAERLDGWRVSALQPWETVAPVAPGAAVIRCTSSIYTIGEQVELPRVTPPTATVFWSPHYNIPVLSRIPLVTTVMDVAHLARRERGGLVGAARTAYARTVFGQVRRRARHIAFISEFSRAEFTRFVGAPRVSSVIPLGVDASWQDVTPERLPRLHARPYILFVGSVKPHKNVAGLIHAFNGLAAELPHDLLIAGSVDGMRTADPAATAAAQGQPDRVRLLGKVSDEQLRAYMAHAALLVLPSFYEGFGLPPLEAMAAGIPVLVSNIAALLETCGNAAVYCDPGNPADICAQLRNALADDGLRRELIARGRERAMQYTWDVTANGMARVLADVSARA